jgi:ferredoxin
MRVKVDVAKCLGNGLCENTAEDVFDLGDNTVVRVALEYIPEARRAQMQRAVEDCPVGALSIHDD